MSDPSGPPPDADRVAVEGVADFDPSDAFDASDTEEVLELSGRFLVELVDVLRGAGQQVREVEGWQQRARGSGGYRTGPVAIIIHHTASNATWDGQRDVTFLTVDCGAAPLANLYLDRSGTWWVLAAGATNTNGVGGPLGPLPLDAANSRVIGIEAGNDGVGEPWPPVMQDAYLAGVAALADAYGIATDHVFAHREWAPSRKIDPAGPSRFGITGRNQSWDMDNFRAELGERRGQAPASAKVAAVATTTPTPAGMSKPSTTTTDVSTYVVRPGDSWWRIAQLTMGDAAANWLVLAGANGGRDRILRPGDVLTVPATDSAPAASVGVAPFPGVAKLDDTGPVVLTWQLALVSRGVIRDTDANRDGKYGQGMTRAMVKLQQSWGLSPADGIANEQSWKRLHGAT